MPAQLDVDLTSNLQAAQAAHAKCVVLARKQGYDVSEQCSLTAKVVSEAWQDWARYRAPFKTDEAVAKLAALNPPASE